MNAFRKPLRLFFLALMVLCTMIADGQVRLNGSYAQTLPPPVPQATSQALYLPVVNRQSGSGDWSQHAHDAQRTGYTALSVPTPWRWKWSWNGPNAQGSVSTGKFGLPRNVQPVTGGGRVYIAAGSRGVFALSENNGGVIWNLNPGGEINSTPAYDPQSGALFVVSSNGRLYRLNAATGQTTGEVNASASSTLPLPPAVSDGRVYFSMGSRVIAVRTADMGVEWSYDAGSPVETPPSVSVNSGLVVAGSADLYVHAIRINGGGRAWRVKPTGLAPGDPGDSLAKAEVRYGWPVIAEGHGLVLVKYRLNWQTLWAWSPWPQTNAEMRANLTSRPDQQALFALRLVDGATAFVSNVGHGGYGDGGYMPMGPQPVVKRFTDGSEVAYVVMRGSPCQKTPCDGRYDSHLGELMLDGTTVTGFQAGYVRFIQNTFFPTDEQANLSMAENDLLGAHWMFGIAHRILDRSPSRGATQPTAITTSNLPHITTSASSCPFSASHYCSTSLQQDGDGRVLPAGFYIYYNQGAVYDQYWRGYAAWIVSGASVYFLSTDGALVALENGSPTTNLVTTETGAAPESAALPAVTTPIPYTLARENAGRSGVVEGEIRYVFNNRKAVLLGFTYPHAGAFKAMILAKDWSNFNRPPEDIYAVGMQVRVSGVIAWYQGDPVIFVERPEAIEIR